MSRTRIVKHEGIDYFAGWPEHQFWKWFAGYFDGEGCIHLPKGHVGFDISVSSTNRDVIESIHRFLQVGYIEEITFDQAGWNTKYSWRVRRWADARSVLLGMRPYLTIKADKADEAIQRIIGVVRRVNAKRERHAEVLRLAEKGLMQKVIAERVGLNRATISVILKRAAEQGLTADDITSQKERPIFARKMRQARQRHTKPVIKVRTAHRRLPIDA